MLNISYSSFVESIFNSASWVSVECLVHIIEGISKTGINCAIYFFKLDTSYLTFLIYNLNNVSFWGQNNTDAIIKQLNKVILIIISLITKADTFPKELHSWINLLKIINKHINFFFPVISIWNQSSHIIL